MTSTHRVDTVLSEDGKLSLNELPFRAGQAVEVIVRAAPDLDSSEWSGLNRRRAELIHQKNREGLSPDEQEEYDRLQSFFQTALERKFPAPTQVAEEVARLEARLKGDSGV